MAQRKKTEPGCDFMAIGAHADDIEIFAGGTVAKLVAQGRKGVLVDLTDASAGTRGTPELRLREAQAAAKSLGLPRVNLGLPDGQLTDTPEAQARLIAAIRRFKPRILLTHGEREEHPDHVAACRIVHAASFKAGLQKLALAGLEELADAGMAHRPERTFHWLGMEPPAASFAVDITATWEDKLAALRCYASQFHGPRKGEYRGKTDLAKPAFLEAVEYRARYFGARIKRRYAEAFYCQELPEITDLTALGGDRFP